MVINQKLDGAKVRFSYPELELELTAGYTGLFFNNTGSLLTASPLTILSKNRYSLIRKRKSAAEPESRRNALYYYASVICKTES